MAFKGHSGTPLGGKIINVRRDKQPKSLPEPKPTPEIAKRRAEFVPRNQRPAEEGGVRGWSRDGWMK